MEVDQAIPRLEVGQQWQAETRASIVASIEKVAVTDFYEDADVVAKIWLDNTYVVDAYIQIHAWTALQSHFKNSAQPQVVTAVPPGVGFYEAEKYIKMLETKRVNLMMQCLDEHEDGNKRTRQY